ncbi:MAG: acyl-CoA dehydrogenase family protein [Candidatus Comchoanobacterales bacterium]
MITEHEYSNPSDETSFFHLFLEELDQWCQDALPTHLLSSHQLGYIDRKIWLELGKLGLLGVSAPLQYGGLNLNLWYQTKIMKTLSFYNPSLGLSYIAHANLCMSQIIRFGNLEQQSHYLPKLISGESIGALAISESHAGSDACSMKLNAQKSGDQYCLNGHKYWITNAPIADVFVVYANTNPKLGKHGISAFIVDRNTPGLSIGQPIQKIGMKQSPTAELIFQDCWLHESQLLGDENQGVYIMMKGLDHERLVLSGGPQGIHKRILSEIIPYANERQQFGQSIGSFQLTQQKLATHYTSYESGHHWLEKLCQKKSVNNIECAGVFLHCAKNAVAAALDGIQIFGGSGYTTDLPMGELLLDAKLYEIGGGTNEIRELLIGKSLLKHHHSLKHLDCLS